MTRTSGSMISATIQLLLLLAGVPVWVMVRLTSPLLPFAATDAVLGLALVGWLLVVRAFLARNNTVDAHVTNRSTPAWQAHRLVDQSYFGAGSAATAAVVSLGRVLAPQARIDDLLPAPLPTREIAIEAPVINLRDVPAPDEEPVVLATETYVVGRGDTFWSIAEAVLGDGRDWQTIQRLNIGREVAPGTELTDADELSIGWTVLIPLRPTLNAEEAK